MIDEGQVPVQPALRNNAVTSLEAINSFKKFYF